jgi:quinol monooxygenase YgiN
MILATLSMAVPPGRREELIAAFWLLLGPVRVEPGCLACGLYQEVGNEDRLLYVEEWQTPEQLERHMRSCRYQRLLAIMEASALSPVLRYHSVSAVRGLEYLETIRLGAQASPPLPADRPVKE